MYVPSKISHKERRREMTFQIKRQTPSLCQKCPDVRRRIPTRTNNEKYLPFSNRDGEGEEDLRLKTLDKVKNPPQKRKW
ncbi:hypothetical protein HBI56_144640 [Parastagonospora nodorum]|nr:hypothetical protein HBH56_032380 [Parastagonospora nodorum]KAH3933831.1 hypothetical protein HBH54_067060 [Parastagonospora nodorum]KAH3979641.1 hypothetical protein HBH51_054010 [Parastagonospora nodorum]KAH3980009.1 hypothetical protein HBH52_090190 [Parastagonospora nodorum]KAH4001999.1 hypothetical protein HBI10_084040 [Parastagonospora nodorum]